MTRHLPEDDWIPVSALQHFSYCPRQCALIHVAQIFDENLYTLRGRSVHRRAHEPGREARGGVRVERGLPIWSKKHGLTGKADVVEFEGDTIRPIEYKAGRLRNRRGRDADRIQLCAQALCLEEMFRTSVEEGDLYYAGSRRRISVPMEQGLRERTLEIVAEVRRQLADALVPPPVNDARCPDCSLHDGCVPATAEMSPERIEDYLRDAKDTEPPP